MAHGRYRRLFWFRDRSLCNDLQNTPRCSTDVAGRRDRRNHNVLTVYGRQIFDWLLPRSCDDFLDLWRRWLLRIFTHMGVLLGLNFLLWRRDYSSVCDAIRERSRAHTDSEAQPRTRLSKQHVMGREYAWTVHCRTAPRGIKRKRRAGDWAVRTTSDRCVARH